MTAIELKQSDQLAAVNLVTLLIYQDNWSQAAKVVGQLGLSPEQVTEAQARAQHLKGSTPAPVRPPKDQVAVVSDTLPASVK
jgi:RNA 3'-terminal phosphate cyclase